MGRYKEEDNVVYTYVYPIGNSYRNIDIMKQVVIIWFVKPDYYI